ncbi:MAG: hypothetical protein WCP53_05775, partial [Verrucomicrobiota bacterium]
MSKNPGLNLPRLVLVRTVLAAVCLLAPERGRAASDPVARFIAKHCVECHDADSKKGGLDLTALGP